MAASRPGQTSSPASTPRALGLCSRWHPPSPCSQSLTSRSRVEEEEGGEGGDTRSGQVTSLTPASICTPRYNFKAVLSEISTFLTQQLPQALSDDPKHPDFVFTWLQLADDLQLDYLRAICMCKVRGMAFRKQLEPLLVNNAPATPSYFPAKPSCPIGHPAGGCMMWCATCIAWNCGYNVNACPRCHSQYSYLPPVRWSQKMAPESSATLRGLSNETLQQMVASLVVSTGGSYIPA
jgi:hypothetical protein